MKLLYRETGGFAGLIKSVEVPLADLKPEETEAINAAAADPTGTPENRAAKLPDLESAQLYLVHADGHWQPLLSDTAEDDPLLRQLAERLGRRARYERA